MCSRGRNRHCFCTHKRSSSARPGATSAGIVSFALGSNGFHVYRNRCHPIFRYISRTFSDALVPAHGIANAIDPWHRHRFIGRKRSPDQCGCKSIKSHSGSKINPFRFWKSAPCGNCRETVRGHRFFQGIERRACGNVAPQQHQSCFFPAARKRRQRRSESEIAFCCQFYERYG